MLKRPFAAATTFLAAVPQPTAERAADTVSINSTHLQHFATLALQHLLNLGMAPWVERMACCQTSLACVTAGCCLVNKQRSPRIVECMDEKVA